MTCVKVKSFKRNSACDCGSGKKVKNCCRGISEYTYINNTETEQTDKVEDNTTVESV